MGSSFFCFGEFRGEMPSEKKSQNVKHIGRYHFKIHPTMPGFRDFSWCHVSQICSHGYGIRKKLQLTDAMKLSSRCRSSHRRIELGKAAQLQDPYDWLIPPKWVLYIMIPAQRGLLQASKQKSYIWARKKNTSFFPLYWLFTRDPYNGFLQSPFNCIIPYMP